MLRVWRAWIAEVSMGKNFLEKWMAPERHPMHELSKIQEEMNSLFDNFFGRSSAVSAAFEFNPSLDVSETDKEIIVKADLPGMSENDIKITVEDDILTLRGQKEESKEEKGETFYRKERSAGSFIRRFQLPVEVESEKVRAVFKDGLLTVKFPKKEGAKRSEVEIKVEK